MEPARELPLDRKTVRDLSLIDDAQDEHPWDWLAGSCETTAPRQQPRNSGFFPNDIVFSAASPSATRGYPGHKDAAGVLASTISAVPMTYPGAP